MPNEITTRVHSDKIFQNPITLRSPFALPKGGLGLALFHARVEVSASDIVPGELLRIRWRVITGMYGIRSQTFRVRFSINNVTIYERDNISAESASIRVTLHGIDESGTQSESIGFSDASVARIVYRIGRKTLVAEVFGRGGEVNETYVNSADFTTVREQRDSSWWEWRSPSFQSIPWKTGYSLVGEFVNRLKFASIAQLDVELSEVRSEHDPNINPCDYVPIRIESRSQIAPNSGTGFAFHLLHDWSWIMAASDLIYGPINKTFDYAILFRFTDEFGNSYAGRCSLRRTRHIGVSKGKRLAGVAAQTAVINAAFWAAVPFVGWGVAAGWYAVASAFGAIAKDPPAPDMHFRDAVDVVAVSLPLALLDDVQSSHSATSALLQIAARLCGLENARTVVRARLLGARLAGDHDGLVFQQQEYRRVETEMVEAAAMLATMLPEVQAETDQDSQLSPQAVEPALRGLQSSGLPASVRSAMFAGGISHGDINGLSSLLCDADVTGLAAENGLFLAPFVLAVHQFVDETLTERDAIFAGEEYVAISNVEWDAPSSATSFQDASGVPLRHDRCQCN